MAQRFRYTPAAAADIAPTVLTVAGVGMAVEQTPAYALWAQVEQAAGKRLDFPPPAGSLQNCRRKAELFRALALGGALRRWSVDGTWQETFVENHALASYVAIPSHEQPFEVWAPPVVQRLRRTLSSGASLPFHDIDPDQSVLWARTRNDTAWVNIFKRFDTEAGLHSLLLFAEDGYATRSETGDWTSAQSASPSEPLDRILSRDKARGDLSEVFASLLLLHRPAVAWVREWSLHFSDDSQTTTHPNGKIGRSAHGPGAFHHRAVDPATGAGYNAPGPFVPVAPMPQPWSGVQMAQYDQMPSLAAVCRPREVRYLDTDQTLLPLSERTALLKAALQAAVEEHLGGKPPTRIFYDAGTDDAASARSALLQQALTAGMPQFRLHDPRAGYDLTQRLGDTGAASAFAAVALASLAAWETGGTALVVNLRRDDGATVLAIQAPDEIHRKSFAKRPYEAG